MDVRELYWLAGGEDQTFDLGPNTLVKLLEGALPRVDLLSGLLILAAIFDDP